MEMFRWQCTSEIENNDNCCHMQLTRIEESLIYSRYVVANDSFYDRLPWNFRTLYHQTEGRQNLWIRCAQKLFHLSAQVNPLMVSSVIKFYNKICFSLHFSLWFFLRLMCACLRGKRERKKFESDFYRIPGSSGSTPHCPVWRKKCVYQKLPLVARMPDSTYIRLYVA